MRALLLLAALALAAPLAAAHVGTLPQDATLLVGPYAAAYSPTPDPPFANSTVSFAILLTSRDTGATVTDANVSVLVGGPAGFTARKQLAYDGQGYFVGSVIPPAAGTYSVRLLVRDLRTNETSSADTDLKVYPDLPFRIQAADAAQDVYVGRLTPLVFEVVDPITLARKDAVPDLAVRVEHWKDDHSEMLGSEDVAPTKTGAGLWRVDHRFASAGMYHVRFASDGGGFNYDDVPLLHVNAFDPPPEEKSGTPGPGALIVLAVAGAAALLLRRR